jgi:hypothetical protein
MLVLAPAAWTATKPRVWLASNDPAVARGSGFHAGEHVTVSVTTSDVSLHRVVTATPSGTFVARWQRSVGTEGCTAISIRAVGDAGSRAVLRIMPECPALQP